MYCKMGHRSTDTHTTKHTKHSTKVTSKTVKVAPKAIEVDGVLLSQTFTTTPITSRIVGDSIYSFTATQAGVLNINCGFSIIGSAVGNDVTLFVRKGPLGGTTLLTSSAVGGTSQTFPEISVFWNGIVAVGDLISIVAIATRQTPIMTTIYLPSFKASTMLYSTPEF